MSALFNWAVYTCIIIQHTFYTHTPCIQLERLARLYVVLKFKLIWCWRLPLAPLIKNCTYHCRLSVYCEACSCQYCFCLCTIIVFFQEAESWINKIVKQSWCTPQFFSDAVMCTFLCVVFRFVQRTRLSADPSSAPIGEFDYISHLKCITITVPKGCKCSTEMHVHRLHGHTLLELLTCNKLCS